MVIYSAEDAVAGLLRRRPLPALMPVLALVPVPVLLLICFGLEILLVLPLR
jgi:hypothetical protein